MRPMSSQYRRSARLALAAAAALAFPGPGSAQSVALEGTWSGSGYVATDAGQREQVKCRVRYVKETANVFAVSAVCASTSVKITQTGSISRVAENRYVGDFHNPEFDISGRVRVVVSGGQQTVTLSSSRGNGSLSLSRN